MHSAALARQLQAVCVTLHTVRVRGTRPRHYRRLMQLMGRQPSLSLSLVPVTSQEQEQEQERGGGRKGAMTAMRRERSYPWPRRIGDQGA